jgi:hypothetical protein
MSDWFDDESKINLAECSRILLASEEGSLEPRDVKWLVDHARKYWTLKRISDGSWARLKIEIFERDREISALKAELKGLKGE